MRRHADETHGHTRPAPGREFDRLLRAIEELRALERERRSVPETGHSQRELDRRVEAKSREVFRIAGEGEAEAADSEPPARSH